VSLGSQWSRFREAIRPRTRWRALKKRGRLRVPRLGGGSPIDFVDWAARTRSGRHGGFPDVWSSRTDLPIEAPSRIGVVVHVYFPELLPELIQHIEQIPVPYDLILTNATGAPLQLPPEDTMRRNIRVFDVDNHGRDILPLVSLVNAGLLDPYHLLLKVHTKKSEWRADHALGGDGAGWRGALLDALLGSPDNVSQILSAFAERPDLGLVTADGSVLGPEFWGDNQAGVANLLRRIELRVDEPSLRFAAGSMYWTRGIALQGLRSLTLTEDDFEPEAGQVNATTAHAVERAIGVLIGEAGLLLQERGSLVPPVSAESWRRFAGGPLRPRARVVPFYLPQFHPVPENDRWWGEGFTEWTNVSAAQPVYQGQYQPRFPRDLGFYDLRLDAVRTAQRDLAADAGIEGFMYYHYWFAGRPLLERPIQALVKSNLDQPFCIMWANENWTRRWDGRHADVLIAQDYDKVPAERFIDDVLPLLADDRYLTVNGRKVIAVYRPGQLVDLPHVIDAWRAAARAAGVGELFVLNVDVDVEFDGLDHALEDAGLDGSLGFPPHNHFLEGVHHHDLEVDDRFEGTIFSYGAMAKAAEARLRSGLDPSYFPGVMVAFDNTPRRQWAPDIWYGSNPYTFRRWLAAAVRSVVHRPSDERLVFVNAWNEWAEGAVLEPNDRFGRSYLLAVRDVVLG
jgi:lipopolysaccharide biosynthesis protein